MEELVPLEVRTLSRVSCYFFQNTNLFGFSELACSRINLALVPRNWWPHQDWPIFDNFYEWLRWYSSHPETGATWINSFTLVRLIACHLGGDWLRVEERELGRLRLQLSQRCVKSARKSKADWVLSRQRWLNRKSWKSKKIYKSGMLSLTIPCRQQMKRLR